MKLEVGKSYRVKSGQVGTVVKYKTNDFGDKGALMEFESDTGSGAKFNIHYFLDDEGRSNLSALFTDKYDVVEEIAQ